MGAFSPQVLDSEDSCSIGGFFSNVLNEEIWNADVGCLSSLEVGQIDEISPP